MGEAVAVAIMSFAGTVFGSLFGVIASAKLTNYRLEQLEKRVDAHNKYGTRIPVLEEQVKQLARQIGGDGT